MNYIITEEQRDSSIRNLEVSEVGAVYVIDVLRALPTAPDVEELKSEITRLREQIKTIRQNEIPAIEVLREKAEKERDQLRTELAEANEQTTNLRERLDATANDLTKNLKEGVKLRTDLERWKRAANGLPFDRILAIEVKSPFGEDVFLIGGDTLQRQIAPFLALCSPLPTETPDKCENPLGCAIGVQICPACKAAKSTQQDTGEHEIQGQSPDTDTPALGRCHECGEILGSNKTRCFNCFSPEPDQTEKGEAE